MLQRTVLQFLQKTSSRGAFASLRGPCGAASPIRTLSLLPSVVSHRRTTGHTSHNRVPSTVCYKFSSSNISTGRNTVTDTEEQKLSTVQKFKLMWKKYGILTVITYFSLYGCTLTGMFFALEADLLSASSFGLDSATVISSFCDTIESWTGNTTLPRFLRENPVYGTAVLAYIMTKFTEPARLGITVLAMPRIARLLGRSA